MGRWDYVLAIGLKPEKVISGHMICWANRGLDFDMGALNSGWFGAICSPYMSGRTGTVYLLCDLFLYQGIMARHTSLHYVKCGG